MRCLRLDDLSGLVHPIAARQNANGPRFYRLRGETVTTLLDDRLPLSLQLPNLFPIRVPVGDAQKMFLKRGLPASSEITLCQNRFFHTLSRYEFWECGIGNRQPEAARGLVLMLPFVVHTDPKGVAGSCFQGRLEKKDGLRQGVPDFADRPQPLWSWSSRA